MRDIEAVLFDFAGTVLVPEPREAWVAGVYPELGPVEVADLAGRLERAGRSGGPEPEHLEGQLADDYERRDLSAAQHRHLYTSLVAPVAGDRADALYERGLQPEGWVAYPEAVEVLAALRARGLKVGVLSNVGFDLRPVFAGHGLAEHVDAFVLSFEVGVMKPSPQIFQAALAALDVEGGATLMVGDNPRADNGGVDLGIRTLLIPYSGPGGEHGLRAVLRLVGLP